MGRRPPSILNRLAALLAVMALALVALAVLVVKESFESPEYLLQENKRAAEGIIGAIEDYRRDHSAYPARLEDLVPAYLAKIESPRGSADGAWFY